MYIYHMCAGWPFCHKSNTPFNNALVKAKKSEAWIKKRNNVGFNINSEIDDEGIRILTHLGVKLVRLGAVGVGRDEGFEFDGLDHPLKADAILSTLCSLI